MTTAFRLSGAHNRCGRAFLGTRHERNEQRTWWVVWLTAAMMIGEIVGGTLYGSMALVADGWHMATHAAALTIAALAYSYARKHRDDPRFAFGTGKVGELAGFASAVTLGIVAVLISLGIAYPAREPPRDPLRAGDRDCRARPGCQSRECAAAA